MIKKRNALHLSKREWRLGRIAVLYPIHLYLIQIQCSTILANTYKQRQKKRCWIVHINRVICLLILLLSKIMEISLLMMKESCGPSMVMRVTTQRQEIFYSSPGRSNNAIRRFPRADDVRGGEGQRRNFQKDQKNNKNTKPKIKQLNMLAYEENESICIK
ncbi:hypothetical protein Mgra_00007362 [Meloidogyne graminicola]|uniref:Uncharacterized protein n=1 Tax=Meloidogyne graminicola TaxID=189291 RepID=A0A8S9ZJA0_9BILA|nr:hypothetical protein Mgra_00007362 [Meloidogyne graminicola]